jgi:hypothetical protein
MDGWHRCHQMSIDLNVERADDGKPAPRAESAIRIYSAPEGRTIH